MQSIMIVECLRRGRALVRADRQDAVAALRRHSTCVPTDGFLFSDWGKKEGTYPGRFADVAPVEAPHDDGRRDADGLALDGDRLSLTRLTRPRRRPYHRGGCYKQRRAV